jgi:hypothetical protein
MGPERSGLLAWHGVLCGWCDKKATGDAKFRLGDMVFSYNASCGKHGEDFKPFPDGPFEAAQ